MTGDKSIRGCKLKGVGAIADLFSVTAPLLIRFPDGSKRVMAEKFRHPEGLLFFELFWHQGDVSETVRLVKGPITGEGPWKVGDCVVTVLGCQGTHPEEAAELELWRSYLAMAGDDYPSERVIVHIARQRGARP